MAARRMARNPSLEISKRMSGQRTKDTAPELALRSELHARGLRFRLQRSVLTGSSRRHDIVFPSRRLAIDVHGCFWHGCEEHYVASEGQRGVLVRQDCHQPAKGRRHAPSPREAGWTHVMCGNTRIPAALLTGSKQRTVVSRLGASTRWDKVISP